MRPSFETGASYALCNLLTLLVFRNGNHSASYSLTHLLSATYQNASLDWDMHLGTPISNARQARAGQTSRGCTSRGHRDCEQQEFDGEKIPGI
jgi:hypothetical protein